MVGRSLAWLLELVAARTPGPLLRAGLAEQSGSPRRRLLEELGWPASLKQAVLEAFPGWMHPSQNAMRRREARTRRR
jgi:hypothetical protein